MFDDFLKMMMDCNWQIPEIETIRSDGRIKMVYDPSHMDGFVKRHLERKKTTSLGVISELFDGVRNRIISYEGPHWDTSNFHYIGKWSPNGGYRLSDFFVLCNNYYNIVPDLLDYLNPTLENIDSYSDNVIHLSILHCFSRISTPVTTKIIENNYSYMIELCRKYHIKNNDKSYVDSGAMPKHSQHFGRILGYVVDNDYQHKSNSYMFAGCPIVDRTCLWNTPLVQLDSAVDIAISFMESLNVEEQRIGTNLIKWMGGVRIDDYYYIMLDILESTSDSDIMMRIMEYFLVLQSLGSSTDIPFDEIYQRIYDWNHPLDPEDEGYENIERWKNKCNAKI